MIYVGICKIQEPATLGELKDTYGILIPETKKFFRLPEAHSYEMKEFGPGAKSGDVIGVLLEFKDNGLGELTFFKNGGSMGKTYTDIKEGEYAPCVSLNAGKNTVLLRSGMMPNEPFKTVEELAGNGNDRS